MAHDLASLITVLEATLQPPTKHKPPLVESLLEKATSLKGLLEESMAKHHRPRGSRLKKMVEALQREIRGAAHEAEDIMESSKVDHMLSTTTAAASRRFLIAPPPTLLLHRVMEKLDAARDKLMKTIEVGEEGSHGEEERTATTTMMPYATSSKPNSTTMVGLDDDALHLKARLTSRRSRREIIPIVGMGGIGKTTLARNLYDDPLVVSHFHVRVWATVTQDFSLRAVLLALLGCIFGDVSDDMKRRHSDELGHTLYQRLWGTRYLVVLDDMWSKDAWDETRRFFPEGNSGSRILITSRELDVAKHPDPYCEEHPMHLLSNAQAWDLLRQKVFDAEKGERCPQSLERIGQSIASGCRGLPLAIVVIGGFLSEENRYSRDSWEHVAKDIHSIVSQRDEGFLEILCLSYDNLPLHLKPCFLYMAAFPEDSEVRGSRLVKLWTAEGFLSGSSGNRKSLEDVAEEYLKALVDKNLLWVARTKPNGKPRSYSMHGLMRDLCVKKAQEERFLSSFNSFRRVSIHPFTEDELDLPRYMPLARSILATNPEQIYSLDISSLLSALRLVRILDMFSVTVLRLPTEIQILVNLRFLAIWSEEALPSGIWGLRNLQTLIVGYAKYNLRLPYEAWEISGLRHIIVKNSTVFIDVEIKRAHEKLQTIYALDARELLRSNLINNMPNVRKLGIRGHDVDDGIVDLSRLHKLENLKFQHAYSSIKFPNQLRKMSLCDGKIPVGGIMNDLSALRYLQVLKLSGCKFELDEWRLNDGVEFCSLRHLSLQYLKIVRWEADDSHFPRLRHLNFQWCSKLAELPGSIGEIPTLEVIEIDEGNHPSLVPWAKGIQDTQRYLYGNEILQVRIRPMEYFLQNFVTNINRMISKI